MVTKRQPKAYSYLRFSTPEQAKGDSFRRQTALADQYAAKHGLQLDTELTFRDLGVSAYRGANLETGRLGDFLEAVHTGLIPKGSYLLVESLDRISRKTARKAMHIVEEICEAGIVLVTLTDQREHTEHSLDSEPMSFVMSFLTFVRSNEESARKGGLLKEAWSKKRATADTTKLTSKCPAWLTLNSDRQGFTINPERAAIVQRIYGETLQGCSPHSIAFALNAEEVPVFGKGSQWHRSYIYKILSNPAVMGTLVPRTLTYDDKGKKQRAKQAEVPDYFPAILDSAIYQRAKSMRKGTIAPRRGRHASGEVSNIFAGGLGRCARCGGAMVRVNKSRKGESWIYLVCAAAKTGVACIYQTVRYANVEQAFLSNVERLVARAPIGKPSAKLVRQIENTETELMATDDAIERLLDTLTATRSAAVETRLRDLEAERATLKATLAELESKQADAAGPLVQSRLDDLLRAAKAKPIDRTRLNAILRQNVERVDIDTESGLLLVLWKQGGTAEVTYAMPKDTQASSRRTKQRSA